MQTRANCAQPLLGHALFRDIESHRQFSAQKAVKQQVLGGARLHAVDALRQILLESLVIAFFGRHHANHESLGFLNERIGLGFRFQSLKKGSALSRLQRVARFFDDAVKRRFGKRKCFGHCLCSSLKLRAPPHGAIAQSPSFTQIRCWKQGERGKLTTFSFVARLGERFADSGFIRIGEAQSPLLASIRRFGRGQAVLDPFAVTFRIRIPRHRGRRRRVRRLVSRAVDKRRSHLARAARRLRPARPPGLGLESAAFWPLVRGEAIRFCASLRPAGEIQWLCPRRARFWRVDWPIAEHLEQLPHEIRIGRHHLPHSQRIAGAILPRGSGRQGRDRAKTHSGPARPPRVPDVFQLCFFAHLTPLFRALKARAKKATSRFF